MKSRRRPAFTTAIAWMARLVSAFSQFLAIRFLIQLLGVDQYASLSIINSVSSWMALSDLGFGLALQNKLSQACTYPSKQKITLFAGASLQVLLVCTAVPLMVIAAQLGVVFIHPLDSIQGSYFYSALLLSNCIWATTGVLSVLYKELYGLDKGYVANIYLAVSSVATMTASFVAVNIFNGEAINEIFAVLIYALPSLLVAVIAQLNSGLNVNVWANRRYLQRVIKAVFSSLLLRQAVKFFLVLLMWQFILNSDYVVMSVLFGAEDIVSYKLIASLYLFVYSLCYAGLLTFWPRCSGLMKAGRFSDVEAGVRLNVFASWALLAGFTAFIVVSRAGWSELLSGGQIDLPVKLIIAFSILFAVRIFVDAYGVVLSSVNETKLMVFYLPIQLGLSIFLQI